MYGSTAYAPPNEKSPTFRKNHEMSKARLAVDSAAPARAASRSAAAAAVAALDLGPRRRQAMNASPHARSTRTKGSRAK